MNNGLGLFPVSASTISDRVDALYFFLIGVTVFFSLLIAGLIVFFAVKYRRNNPVDRTPPKVGVWVEAVWIGVPLVIVMIIFLWGAILFFDVQRAPANAMVINVVGQQWMWKFQHPQGRRETDNLHVPVGQPVLLRMISQDVIHSVFVPAFRVKQDVLPGRYSSLWFEATKPGSYDLFCAEYCGKDHSAMTGKVIVMTPSDYQAWLGGTSGDEPPAVVGERLFEQFRCGSCHRTGSAMDVAPGSPQTRGPSLVGLYGSKVPLTSGRMADADDAYIRESILKPNARVVAGFQPIMPTFEGQISEENILDLIAYIRSLDATPEKSK